ncbi:MDM2-like protein, partial [Operophtera brumata]
VVEVSCREGDLVFADSERTDSQGSDSEIDFHDYWLCAHMSSQPLSQDSGIAFTHSQESQGPPGTSHSKTQSVLKSTSIKRRSESVDRLTKRAKYSESSESESESKIKVIPLAKTISDPAITIEDSVITKKIIVNSLKEIERVDAKELCVICITEPKSGVFVHGRIAHICCCYKCAKKVWAKAKRCPVCNCKISNVLKAVVM